MEQKFCQSCGMPMSNAEVYGTEANGIQNDDYCKYCYEAGEFTYPCSMQEMINVCVPQMTESNPNMTADQARQMMMQFFPNLKRWKNA